MRPAFHCQSNGKSRCRNSNPDVHFETTNVSLAIVFSSILNQISSGGLMASDPPVVSPSTSRAPIPYSIAPWLSIRNGARAVEFYKAAFGAVESHHLEDPTGAVVAKLSVNGAVFWVSGDSPGAVNNSPESVGGGTVRIVLIVPDPDAAFARALKAGASEIFPVGEEHGWRLGRVVDPFGLHWEIGHELDE
jgi:PhnB protein